MPAESRLGSPGLPCRGYGRISRRKFALLRLDGLLDPLEGASHAFDDRCWATQQRLVHELLRAMLRRILVGLGDLRSRAGRFEPVPPRRVSLRDELEHFARHTRGDLRCRCPLLQRDPEQGDTVISLELGAHRRTGRVADPSTRDAFGTPLTHTRYIRDSGEHDCGVSVDLDGCRTFRHHAPLHK